MKETKKQLIDEVISSIVENADKELFALKEQELSSQWYWRWEELKSREWNTYTFLDALELHKRRCRRWEEHHNGYSLVVERVRDKYVMPRVREFLSEIASRA